MDSIKNVANVAQATTATLIEFYNHHNAAKQIKKFADRQTAVARCEKLARELGLPETGEVETEAEAKTDVQQPAANSGWGKMFNDDTQNGEDEGEDEEEAKPAAPSMLGTLVNGPTEAQKQATASNAAKATQVKDGKKVDPNAKEEEKDHSGRASNSAGVAASWLKPEVFQARLTRDGVTVTVDGQTTEHTSTRLAFRAYRLPQSKHIRFRMKLKADRKATFQWNGKDYVFEIAQISAESAE